MKLVYVKLNDYNKVVRFDTNKIADSIQVEVEDDMLINGKIMSCYYTDNNLSFNEQEYNDKIHQKQEAFELAQKQREDEAKLQSIEMYHRLSVLSDDEAVSVISLFPVWNKDEEEYAEEDRFVYNGDLYKALHDVVSDKDSTPDVDAENYVRL